ncbi:transposase [bacterium]|nr:transposase [bacterium]
MDKYKKESGLLDSGEGLSKLLFDIKPLNKKPIELSFTSEKVSSDGGLLLLREVENQIGILSALTNCIDDTRHPGYIQHSLDSMLTQRVFQIAAGYEDANDSDTLRDDLILKICSGKAPEQGKPLSSQPTMSRFENAPASKALYKMGVAFVDNFINSYAQAPAVIILDCDDTNSDTHGAQQLALYNDYYGEYCYMPLHIYEGFSGKVSTFFI